LFNNLGINLFVVDYRGYGSSTGSPSVTSMMTDCHAIFDFVKKYMEKQALTGPILLMGRSLGSASALELAATRKNDINTLIIESGFAFSGPLLNIIGVNSEVIGFRKDQGFENLDKIKSFTTP
jgi:pimeloyl-ACP methyl ester carboxylesterase